MAGKYKKRKGKNEELRYIRKVIGSQMNQLLMEISTEEILEILSQRKLYAQEEGRFVPVEDRHIDQTILYRSKEDERQSQKHSISSTFAIRNKRGFQTIRKMYVRIYKGKIIYHLKSFDDYGAKIADHMPELINRFVNQKLEQQPLDRMLMMQGKALDAIGSNPNCEHLRIAGLHRSVLDSIPDDITMLYPNARRLNRQFYLHVGGTNSGKTYEALNACMDAASGVYLAPLRLLALECQEKMLQLGVVCSMITGEEEHIIPEATHMSSTVELLDPDHYYEVCVIDEAQMLSDEMRGWAWTKAILGVFAQEVHVCMSEDALPIVKKLIDSCKDEYEVVWHKRNTPLVVENEPFDFPDNVREHDALVVFSRRNVLSVASELKRQGIEASVIYGALPYDVRKNELHKFAEGTTKVVVTTDAIGMGMNLPVERIVFMETEKYDGKSRRFLNSSEVKQIAGRAGRKGIYDKGYVNAISNRGKMKHLLEQPYKAIKKARIQMPERLLDLDLPLANTLNAWARTANEDLYEKANIEENLRRINLIDELMVQYETELPKKLQWQFALVPYDEKNNALDKLWMHIVTLHITGMDIFCDFDSQVQDTEKLDELETNYKKLDLYFSFARILRYDNGEKEAIMREKAQVATMIMNALGDMEAQHKTCRMCKRKLAWNYRYGICNRCHAMQTGGFYKKYVSETAVK
ncbi:helicase-related protein [Eubacterium oxidoreducens]|uniref:ATP-dependent RNA helicase SUPV3L1/SUV3 n=1 Tax=Eubacterium oxidoreducens TaxID=1732 RepID=A0A1G6BHA0_EUBOX|nr:helicase-related protein [Eubacterium oxidoreducens]SDB19986.1 ATP-dependent RNA helicase SUPV3L1/SUV3 [Eubacterium oxidoreducens]